MLGIIISCFDIQVPGVYHLSFTGLFHAENGHGVNADIVRVTPSGKTDYLGRSAADINEISTFFSSGNYRIKHVYQLIHFEIITNSKLRLQHLI